MRSASPRQIQGGGIPCRQSFKKQGANNAVIASPFYLHAEKAEIIPDFCRCAIFKQSAPPPAFLSMQRKVAFSGLVP
ncbi:hypothetical protein E8K88_04360 [Lampropedia aestuarii]|uniref:Uncharacterized protein n=1 Tax=Lampropedia aestuarii TaxID=2562762 RepID=A0A4S5BVY6_9BURK|nr:hypothetical protein [Lampropedia aestuarii]THJ35235.1 hypothetical protein E8K88_04360 [Lampropedia aestuarii]